MGAIPKFLQLVTTLYGNRMGFNYQGDLVANGKIMQASLGLDTANTSAAAVFNTSAIQAALTAGGLVQITTPGTYYLSPTTSLVMPSKTTFYRGPGVRLLSLDGRVCPVIRNKYAGNLIAGPQLVRASNVVTVSEIGHTKAAGDQVFVGAASSSGTDSSFLTLATVTAATSTTWSYASTGSNGTAGASTVFYSLIPVRQTLDGTAFVATATYVTVTEAGHDKRPGMNVWIGKAGGDNFAPGVVQVIKVSASTWTYKTASAAGTASGTFALSYDYDITIDGEGTIDGNRAGLGSPVTGSNMQTAVAWFGCVSGLRINSRIGGSNFRGVATFNCANVLLDKMWSPFDTLVGYQAEGGGQNHIIDQAAIGASVMDMSTAQQTDDYVAFTGTACVGGGGNYDNTCSPYGLTFFSGLEIRRINPINALNGVKMTTTGASCPFVGTIKIGAIYGRALDNNPLLTRGNALNLFDDGPGLVGTIADIIDIAGPIEWTSPTGASAIKLAGAGSVNAVYLRGMNVAPSVTTGVIFGNTVTIKLLEIDASQFAPLGTNNVGINCNAGTIRKIKVRDSLITVGTSQPFLYLNGATVGAIEFDGCQVAGESSGVGDLVQYGTAASLAAITYRGTRRITGGNGFGSILSLDNVAAGTVDIEISDHDVTSASGMRSSGTGVTGTFNVFLGPKVRWAATGGNNFLQMGGGTWNLYGNSANRATLPATRVFLTGFGTPTYTSLGFTQIVASSATPALDCGLGNNVTFTATAASTWGAPTNIPPAGERVTITITQNATGGWAISWNAAYIFPTAWSNTGNTANTISEITFVSNGTKLVAQGANVWHT